MFINEGEGRKCFFSENPQPPSFYKTMSDDRSNNLLGNEPPEDDSDTSSVEIVDTYEAPIETLSDNEIVVTAQRSVEPLTGSKRSSSSEEPPRVVKKPQMMEFTDPNVISSELRLSRIDDLGAEVNSDTVGLEYILNQAGLKYMVSIKLLVNYLLTRL